MTVSGCFFLLLIFGVQFRRGNCEVFVPEWPESFEEAKVRAACSLECSDEPCITNCTETKQIKELNEEARSNVRLICQDADYAILGHNLGLFVINRRHTLFNSPNNFQWGRAYVSNGTKVLLYLPGSVRHQFYFHRISAGGISMPDVTEWMTRMPVGYRPMNVTSITIGAVESENRFSEGWFWKVEISFTPANDRPCFYTVICQQVDGEYHETINLKDEEDFHVGFERLPFGGNFMLTVRSLTNELKWSHSNDVSETTTTFSTQRCLHPSNPTSCVPGIVEGLNATAIHKMGNIFDVHLTWDKPDRGNYSQWEPPVYSVDIHPIGGGTEDRVSKKFIQNSTLHFVIQNVKILDQYDVYISGKNWIGTGPKIVRRFTTGLKRIDLAKDIRLAVYLMSSILIMVIGIAAYGYYRLQKRRLEKTTLMDEFEMSPERLTITQVLGTGAFGVVKLASLRDYRGNISNVAVKMLQDDTNENDRRNFLQEIQIMKTLDEHPNIICLLGCNTTGLYPFLVMEYCSRGDLQSFLQKSLKEQSMMSEGETIKRIVPTRRTPKRKEILQANSRSASIFRHRDNYVQVTNCIDEPDTNCDSGVVTVMDMLNFGRQVATGMEFLSSCRIVHRDLAARNILVCCNRTVKISDFGLSRDVYRENIYKKLGNGRMPLKWMAIEALTHQIYTTHSDVWSFGILLWEIMTLGGDPYPGVPTIEILNWLQSGCRMEQPANCSMSLYNVMMSCWQTRPKDRPTFTILRQELDKLICATTKSEYFDLNDILEEVPSEDDDSQISISHPTSHPPLVAILNDLEGQNIIEVPEETMDEPEMS